jgi:Leucine-rich repeat (LRR) protein
MSSQHVLLLQMHGLKELHIEGELHVQVLSDLTHALVEQVTAIETLNIHSSNLTPSHKEASLQDARSYLLSMCKAIARLPCLKRLSLSNCNLYFTIAQLWPYLSFKTSRAFQSNSQSFAQFKSLEVLDLSHNGLEEIHLCKLFELFLKDYHVENADVFGSLGTGFTPGAAYRPRVLSWFDVNLPHSGMRNRWNRHKNMLYVSSQNASYVPHGVNLGRGCKPRRCERSQEAQGMEECGRALGLLATLQSVDLRHNQFSHKGSQRFLAAVRAATSRAVTCDSDSTQTDSFCCQI